MLIFLCGCTKPISQTAILNNLQFDAEISSNDEKHNFFVSVNENGDTEMVCTDDLNISGTAFKFSQNGLTVSYNKLEYKTDINSLPDGINLDMLYCIFKNTKTDRLKSENDLFFINGNTEKYKYKIYFGQTGLPIKIEEENFNISVLLKNVSFKK